jgi:dTDP-4-amino-4,6-dideoxygalactose transaminase
MSHTPDAATPPQWVVPLTQPTLGTEEVEAATRVLQRQWLSMGEEVAAFEREFAAAVGARHAVAVSSGTAALRLCYEAAGLRPGDAIAMPALTFVCCLNLAVRMGLEPVLLDVESETDLTLSVRSLERALVRHGRIRAVVSMPYGGWAPRMAELADLCAQAGAKLIEDACHAPLARTGGRAIGTFGHSAAWSFFPNKNMTTGEGGMVTTEDGDVAARLRRLRSHGMTTLTWDRHRGHASDYDVEAAGENFRMDEMRAAIGRAQLAKLPAANSARVATAARLAPRLRAAAPGLVLPFHDMARPADEVPAGHLLVALLPEGMERAAFRRGLSGRRVQSSVHYPPLYGFSHMAADLAPQLAYLPVMQRVAHRIVTLPLAPNFSAAQEDHLVAAVGEAFAAAKGASA